VVQERERDVGGNDDDTGLELHEETGELGAEFNKNMSTIIYTVCVIL
jgi:hypothetical protein